MIEIKTGVYLQTRKELISDQKDWSENDKCKDMNFSLYPYWVTTVGETVPEGFDTIDNARNSIN